MKISFIELSNCVVVAVYDTVVAVYDTVVAVYDTVVAVYNVFFLFSCF